MKVRVGFKYSIKKGQKGWSEESQVWLYMLGAGTQGSLDTQYSDTNSSMGGSPHHQATPDTSQGAYKSTPF